MNLERRLELRQTLLLFGLQDGFVDLERRDFILDLFGWLGELLGLRVDAGHPVFDRLRYGRQPQTEARLFAFDLLELGGEDLRRSPLEDRKRQLAKLLRKASRALHFNEHIDTS